MREETRHCGVVVIDMNTGEVIEDSRSQEDSSEQADKKHELPRHIPTPQPRLQEIVPTTRKEDTYKPWLF